MLHVFRIYFEGNKFYEALCKINVILCMLKNYQNINNITDWLIKLHTQINN